MTPNLPNPQVTDEQLAAALSAEHDGILPSSGFADAVMLAVQAEAAAPAPIPFPWKRAIPGLIGAAAALAMVVAWLVRAASAGPAAAAEGTNYFWQNAEAASLLHQATSPDAVWVVVSLAIPLVCLLAMRRALFGR